MSRFRNTVDLPSHPRVAGHVAAFMIFFAAMISAVRGQDLEVGLTGGGCYYLGDLNPGKHFTHNHVMYGLVARYNFDTRWAVKITGVSSKISGDAASSWFLPERGLAFTSTLTDISATAEFNFLPYFTGSRMSSISPYILGGFSVFFFDPYNNGIRLRPMGTEGQNIGYDGRKPYGSVSLSFPFGLGCKFSIAKRLSLQVYWEMHKTFNDYLDDVSTTYYLEGATVQPGDISGLASDPTLSHEPGMQRGNSSNKDWFAVYGLSLTYKFNLMASQKCRDLEH